MASIIKKIGPCGGIAGDMKDMDCNGISQIVRISVRHSAVLGICSLTVRYIRNGREESTGEWGQNRDANLSEFNLQSNEFIKSVKGHFGKWKDWVNVRSLRFETNLGNFGPYGQEEGIPFELPAINGRIVGFHAIAGTHIEALGIYVKVDGTTGVET